MAAQLFRIRDVDSPTVSWRAKVIVCEKINPRRFVSSPTVYQRITLMDAEGHRVVASLYASNIQLFQDVLRVVIDKRGSRSVLVDGRERIFKEYALMNEEKEVVIMTPWNKIADSEGAIIDNARESLPIIRAPGLTVSKYYDGSLGSTPSTVIVKNPWISEGRELIAWRDANLSAIIHCISTVSHLARSKVSSTSQNDGVILVDGIVKKMPPNLF